MHCADVCTRCWAWLTETSPETEQKGMKGLLCFTCGNISQTAYRIGCVCVCMVIWALVERAMMMKNCRWLAEDTRL